MTMKQCRRKASMTTEMVAKRIGITEKRYIFYERHPELTPVTIAILFSLAVNVPVDDIFFARHSNKNRVTIKENRLRGYRIW